MIIHSSVLENGVKVVVVQSKNQRTTTAGVFLRQGARNETFEQNGISHFVEHVISNTSKNATHKKHVTKMISNGGILNATTTKDITFYFGTCLSTHTADLLKALQEMVFEARFTEDIIEHERKIITDEFDNKLKTTGQIFEHFWETIYGNMTYGQWVIGRREFISSVNAHMLEEFYNQHYVADNTTVVIISDLDIYEIISITSEIFGEIQSGMVNPNEVKLSTNTGLKIIPSNSQQLSFCLGSYCPSFRDSHTTEFELLIALWGSIPSSRLFNTLREQKSLVYQVQSFSHSFVQTGNFGVTAYVNKKSLPEFINALYEEIYRLRNVPFEQEEINRGISVLKTFLLTRLSSPDFLLKLIGLRATFGHHFFLNQMIRELERVTPEKLLNIAREVVIAEEMSLVCIGDVSAEEILDIIHYKEVAV